MAEARDHGGGIDAAIARWGGTRDDWLDLSTGINPVAYPVPPLPHAAWTALPDREARDGLLRAARGAWRVPAEAEILAAPGTSAIIAALPGLLPPGPVHIPAPTYNEHRAAFVAAGHRPVDGPAPVRVLVHPNNPDGRLWHDPPDADLTIIDESFCDTAPDRSHVDRTRHPGTVVLKSFGKFWGLAGLRLGFAIGHPDTLAGLAERLGPWAVSGPALAIGARALADAEWARTTRLRLAADARTLDDMLGRAGLRVIGGTTLFRLVETPDAAAWHAHLASTRILTRVFPYAPDWLRLGLPHPDRTGQLADALSAR